MKLAITIWTERVAPVFDVAGHLLLIEKDETGILTRTEIDMTANDGMDRVSFLLNLNVDEVICGAISKPVYHSAINNNIKVYPFVAGGIDEVVDAWKNDQLNALSYSMPGCRRERCRKNCQQFPKIKSINRRIKCSSH